MFLFLYSMRNPAKLKNVTTDECLHTNTPKKISHQRSQHENIPRHDDRKVFAISQEKYI